MSATSTLSRVTAVCARGWSGLKLDQVLLAFEGTHHQRVVDRGMVERVLDEVDKLVGGRVLTWRGFGRARA